MIYNTETDRTSLCLANTQHHTDRFYICDKVALSSTSEQISDSWSHTGLSDKTPKK